MLILPYYTWINMNPPVIPKLYWGALSQEQRIAEMCKKIAGLESYMSYLSKQTVDMGKEIRDEVLRIIDANWIELNAALDDLRRDTSQELQALRDWVEAQTFTSNVWDVTTGSNQTSVTSMRRLFADVTIYGTTVDKLATSNVYPTVDQLSASNWNVRALAVRGADVLEDQDPGQWTPSN